MEAESTMLQWLFDNIWPWMTYVWVLILAILIVFTFSGHVEKTGDKSAFHFIIEAARKKLLVAWLLCTAVAGLFVYIVAWKYFGEDFDKASEYINLLYERIGDPVLTFGDWCGIVFIFLLPYALQIYHRRFLRPKLSAWFRRFRVSQTSDTMSDIRIEQGKYQPKNFNPLEWYREGEFFFGMDDKNLPIYKSDDYLSKVNIKILGATQTGKGVIQGVLADQAIMKGWGVWFWDQKPDKFIYSIMKQRCISEKKEIFEIDINGEGIGEYAPFEHGTKREILDRFFSAFGLETGGTDADYYKNNAQEVMYFIFPFWDRSLKDLKKLLSGHDKRIPEDKQEWIQKSSGNIRTQLNKWLELPGLSPKKGEGLNITELIKNGSVVYVKGSTKDKVVRAVLKTMLREWSTAVIREQPEKHIFGILDEARFVISSEVADSLATILSSNASLSIAYQERDDLLNIPDEKPLIAQSIKKGAETNTNLTLVYRCNDETAEWIAKNSGTTAKSLTKLEEVDTDGYGAENWKGRRMIGQQEEYYIPVNTVLAVEERVGIMQTMFELSRVLFTCWVPVEKFYTMPARQVQQEIDSQYDDVVQPEPEYDFNPDSMSDEEKASFEAVLYDEYEVESEEKRTRIKKIR
ncbi:hypothetical protein [Klebsiella pneumoniae]|uniref:hypothetical protein n=1 Tax=Klebsiella pneumoniae TaxID=573 RepID=UPI00273988F2|nr:hypothetical protein [Klebsiella pneumoniae]